MRISEFVETTPVDAPPPMFLNAAVVGYTSMGPHALLHSLLALEKKLGRARRGIRNEPRIIDLDLIAYGAVHLRTPELTLPHPRATCREFVMKPLQPLTQWPYGRSYGHDRAALLRVPHPVRAGLRP